jgi:hypothetical protein
MKTLEAERLDLKQAAAYLGIPTRPAGEVPL